jgi:altronate dehydratase
MTSYNSSTTVVRHIASRFTDKILSEYPNVDAVIALTHDYGFVGCAGIGINLIQTTIVA